MVSSDGVSEFEDSPCGLHPLEFVGAPPLEGDWYREADDVCRGVSLCIGPHEGLDFAGGAFWYDESPGKAKNQYVPFGVAGVDILEEGENFAPSDRAPQRPVDSDPNFGLKTVVVSGESSSSVANRLLDIIRDDIDTFLTKVNTKKFTLKATTFSHGLACELKVYIYTCGPRETALEFQRRDGDAISFSSFYGRVKSHLLNRQLQSKYLASPACATGCPEDDLELPPPACNGVDFLSPLLAMASCVTSTMLQAEAAAGFATALASSKQQTSCAWMATQLHDTKVTSALSQLRCANELAVRHPASRLQGDTYALCNSMEDAPTFILGR
jgi:hypothetical protein